MDKVKVGIVGLGYWGPNLLGNFHNHPEVSVEWICDLYNENIRKYAEIYKIKRGTTDFREMLKDDIDLVVIATPPSTHYEIAKESLLSGKNILVEKPFTKTSKEGEELIEIADKRNLKIFVDHTLIFNPVTRKIKEIAASGEIGDIIFLDSKRIKGPIRNDINVLWDLASHDISIALYILNAPVKGIHAFASNKIWNSRRSRTHNF